MRRLTLCQRLVLLATLIIALNGILRSPVFDEPEEGVGNMSKNKVRLEASIAMGCEVSRQQCADWQRKAALWDQHGYWRAPVSLIIERIKIVRPFQKTVDSWLVARSIVRAARTHQLAVGWVGAIAETESEFNPRARGKNRERGLMQVLPLPGRDMIAYTDLLDGPTNALRDFFMPGYNKAIAAGKPVQEAIGCGLLQYNGSKSYVADVFHLHGREYQGGLWDEIPQ